MEIVASGLDLGKLGLLFDGNLFERVAVTADRAELLAVRGNVCDMYLNSMVQLFLHLGTLSFGMHQLGVHRLNLALCEEHVCLEALVAPSGLGLNIVVSLLVPTKLLLLLFDDRLPFLHRLFLFGENFIGLLVALGHMLVAVGTGLDKPGLCIRDLGIQLCHSPQNRLRESGLKSRKHLFQLSGVGLSHREFGMDLLDVPLQLD
mmetsp:Transcript_33472/g.87849  ORF Transcript_33472/g.87849 Transcript_33472/m.87849 type:complete len:204 (-) Transcript_33472:1122-1733(-)